MKEAEEEDGEREREGSENKLEGGVYTFFGSHTNKQTSKQASN